MLKLLKVNLHAFDGDGAAPAASSEGSTAASAQPQAGSSAPGVQPQANPQNAPEGTPPKPTFEELIRGEYKQDYDTRVQEALNRRLRSKNAELDALRPVMAALQQRYGIADGSGAPAAILEALNKDDAYWQSAADKAGMTVEQYRRMAQAEAESRQFRAILAQQQTEALRNETYRQLCAQAEQLKAKYPNFDLNAELETNPRFGGLLRNHIDMQTAYEVCHQQELLAAAAQQAQTQTMEKVRANQSRPSENGSGSTQPVKLSGDPSKWTKKQFREVYRRAQLGERIVL